MNDSDTAGNVRDKVKPLLNEGSFKDALDILNEELATASERAKVPIYMLLGDVQHKMGDIGKSIDSFAKAAELASETDDAEILAKGQHKQGSVYLETGRFEKSKKIFQKSLKNAEKSGNTRLQFDILSDIALIHKHSGYYKEAVGDYTRALKIAEKLNDSDRKSEAYLNIAAVYVKSGDDNQAEKTLKAARNLNDVSENSIANQYSVNGYYHLTKKDYGEAIQNMLAAEKIYTKLNSREDLVAVYERLGRIYCEQSQYDLAADYYSQSAAIAGEVGNNIRNMVNLTSLAELYLSAGQNDEGLDAAKNAIKVAEKLNKGDSNAPFVPDRTYARANIIYNNYLIAEHYRAKREDDAALEFYLQILPLNERLFSKISERTSIISKIARCYQNLGQYNIAIDYIEQAISVNEQQSDQKLKTVQLQEIYKQLGEVYRIMEDFSKSTELFKKSAKILHDLLEESDDKSEKIEEYKNALAKIYGDIGLNYESAGDFKHSEDFYGKGIKTVKDTRCIDTRMDLMESLAELYYENSRVDEAIDIYKQTAVGFRNLGMSEKQAESYNMIGNSLYRKEQFERAIQHYKSALEIAERLDSKEAIRVHNLNIAGCYYYLKQEKETVEYYKKSIYYCDQLGNLEKKAQAYFQLGRFYSDMYLNYGEAVRYLKKSIAVLKKIEDKKQLALTYYFMGSCLKRGGNPEEAIKSFRREQELNKELGKEKAFAVDYAIIGNCYQALKMNDENLKYQEMYLEAAKDLNLDNEIATAYHNIGRVYAALEDFKTAVDYYERSYETAEKSNDVDMMDDALNGITEIYYDHDKERAIEYYNKRLELHEKVNNSDKIILMNKYIAKMNADLGRREKALEYYNIARAIAEESGDKFEIAQNYANAGYQYSQSNKFEDAADYYQKAVDMRRKTGDLKALATDLGDLGLNYDRNGQYQESYDAYLEKYQILKGVGDTGLMITALSELANAAENIQDYKHAAEHYTEAVDLAMNIDDINKASGLLGGLGRAHMNLGDRDKSEAAYLQQKKIGEDYRDWNFTSRAVTRMADMYEHFNEYSSASDYHELAALFQYELGQDPTIEYLRTAIALYQDGENIAAFGFWRFVEQDKDQVLDQIKAIYGDLITEISSKFEDLQNQIEKGALSREVTEKIESLLEKAETSTNDGYRDVKRILLHRAYVVSIILNDPTKSAGILQELAEQYDELNRHQAAFILYKDALLLYGASDNRIKAVEMICAMGKKLMDQKQFDKALGLYEEAEKSNNTLKDDQKPVRAWKIQKGFGDVFWNLEAYDKAIPYFQNALNVIENTDHLDEVYAAVLDLAYTYRKQGNYEKSNEYYKKGVKLSQKLDKKILEAKCLNEIGKNYLDFLNQSKEAIEYFKKSYEAYKAINKHSILSTMARNIAVACWFGGQREQALDWFEKVYEIHEEQNNTDKSLAALSELADMHRQNGNYDVAETKYNELLRYAEEVNSNNTLQKAYRGLARIYFDQGQYVPARQYFEKEVDVCLEMNDDLNRQDALQYLGKIAFETGDSEKAQTVYLQAADVNKKIQNYARAVDGYMNAAYINRMSGNLDLALEIYEIAADLAHQVKAYEKANMCYGNIAMIHTNRGEHEISSRYFLAALDLCKEWGNQEMILQRMFDAANVYERIPDYEAAAEITMQKHEFGLKIGDYASAVRDLNNLGQIYYDIEDYPKSIRQYLNGIKLAEEHGVNDEFYHLYQNLGTAYRNNGDYGQAVQTLNKAIEYAKESKHKEQIEWSYGSLAITYLKQEDFEKAIDYRKKGLEIATEIENLAHEIMHLKGLVELYENKSDFENAWEYRKLLRRAEEEKRNIEQEKEYTTPYEGKIEDLFPTDEKYTFLVGAGISMNPPSNLSSARLIVRDLLELCGPEEEVDRLLEVRGLRYEMIVETIQDMFDDDLDFMEYFEEIKEPNLVHLLCAYAIKNGNDIVTTNFDYLIEFALKQIISENEIPNITPVITKNDFQECSSPEDLHKDGNYPIYKIHGSSENIITHVDTRESLITTISALGKGKEEGTTFAIETHKKPAVYNLMNKRTLVVMGYSGSDDFDIGPTLKELPNLNRIIWINHTFDDEISAYKVKKFSDEKYWKNLLGVYPLLAEIKHDMDYEVIRINANTLNIIKTILWDKFAGNADMPDLSEIEYTPLNFKEFARDCLKNVTPGRKYKFASEIYSTVLDHEGVSRVIEKGMIVAEQEDEPELQIEFLFEKGKILRDKTLYEESEAIFNKAKQSAVEIDDWRSEAFIDIAISVIFSNTGEYQRAQSLLDEAVAIYLEHEDNEGLMSAYLNLGSVYWTQGFYLKATDYLDRALEISEDIGSLHAKVHILTIKSNILRAQRKYEEERNLLHEALQISISIGALLQKADIINNLGLNAKMLGRLDEAMNRYEEALDLNKKLNYREAQIANLSNTAMIHLDNKEDDKALDYLEQALKMAEAIKNKKSLAHILNNIGMLYLDQGKAQEAHEHILRSLRLFEEIGNKRDADFIRGNMRDVMAQL